MKKIKTVALSILVLSTFSFAPVTHGATTAETQAQISKWEGYVVQLQKLIDLCQAQIRILQSQNSSTVTETKAKTLTTVYSITVPEGTPSTVKQPKNQMTMVELRKWTANLWSPYVSTYGDVLNKFSDQQVIDLLNTNGYKVVSERI